MMKITIWSLILLLTFYSNSRAQNIIHYKQLKFINYSNSGILNTSFVNKRMVFLNGKYSVFLNMKIAFNFKEKDI